MRVTILQRLRGDFGDEAVDERGGTDEALDAKSGSS